ncbi:MAG: type I methionyl aminopeptidase [Victivallales bacterium]|nr:type I methionyl aminopeptidase [Victivallales bacterium]
MTIGRKYVRHSDEDICGIRKAAKAAASVRHSLSGLVMPGMTTGDIDRIAAGLISAEGGTSAFCGYRGFPGNLCVSINDEVVHGIGSSSRSIQRGDLVSIDVGVKLGSCIGDTATSFIAGGGEPEDDVKRLMAGTLMALEAGIKAAVPSARVGDISAAVEETAKRYGLGIVREYVGHGCGKRLHEPPEIPNFTSRDKGVTLRPGMVLAIEPMLNLGRGNVIVDRDGWTVRTKDASLSAHFEHMVLITDSGPEILTWPKM